MVLCSVFHGKDKVKWDYSVKYSVHIPKEK